MITCISDHDFICLCILQELDEDEMKPKKKEKEGKEEKKEEKKEEVKEVKVEIVEEKVSFPVWCDINVLGLSPLPFRALLSYSIDRLVLLLPPNGIIRLAVCISSFEASYHRLIFSPQVMIISSQDSAPVPVPATVGILFLWQTQKR